MIIFETKYWEVELAEDQAYLGRCFVNLKRKSASLSDLKKEEWTDFGEIVKNYESALKKGFGATMFNWTCLMNNAYKDKEPKPEVHFHVRPRYNSPVKFAGIFFEDKEFAHHYDNKRVFVVNGGVLSKIAEKIKENLS